MPYGFEVLDIRGHRGRQLGNTFVRQSERSAHLAVLFPGLAYTADMPLLYYTRAVLLDLGADALSIETDYHRQGGFASLPEEERSGWVAADARAAVEAALRAGSYTRYTLVGKSLGTLAAAHVAATDPRMARADCVWLTPPLGERTLAEMVRRGGQRGLFVAGTADPYYEAGRWRGLLDLVPSQGLLVPGANHSLEIPGDVDASVQALAQLVTAVRAFALGAAEGRA